MRGGKKEPGSFLQGNEGREHIILNEGRGTGAGRVERKVFSDIINAGTQFFIAAELDQKLAKGWILRIGREVRGVNGAAAMGDGALLFSVFCPV